MPHPQPLDPAVRAGIAAQIGLHAPVSAELEAPGAVSALGESLRVMLLPEEAVRADAGPMSDLLVDTGQWHHQVYSGGRAASFARSVPASGAAEEAHDVVELARSPLPEAISQTIDWVDAHMQDDATADLFVAPAYSLTGLWIHGDGADCVVVAAAGQGLQGIPLNTRLDSDDFLRRLAQNDSIPGLGLDPPDADTVNERRPT